MSRNSEVEQIAGQLEALLDQLAGNVAELNSILDPDEAAPQEVAG